MTKKVSAAQAKAQLSELVSQVAYGGERVIIERRGKPLAVLVSVEELERLDADTASSARPDLFESLLGIAEDIPDEKIDEMVKHIYQERERDGVRPSPFEERSDRDL